MKNEDKVGQRFILKRAQSKTEKFEKEDKVGQTSVKKEYKVRQNSLKTEQSRAQ